MRAIGGLGLLSASCSKSTIIRVSRLHLQTAAASTSGTSSHSKTSNISGALTARIPPQSLSRRPIDLDYRKVLRSCSTIFDNDTPLRSDVWRGRLERAERALERSHSKPTRIAVIGGSASSTADFLNCLLDEPMNDKAHCSIDFSETHYDNQTKLKALKDRYSSRRGLHRCLHIRYGKELGIGDQSDVFSIPHTWLRESNVEFVEILDPTTSSTTLDELYASDMIIFVTDDLTLASHYRRPHELTLDPSLQLLRYFANKPGTCVLVNHITTHLFESKEYSRGLENAIGSQAYSEINQLTRSSKNPSNSIKPDAIIHASFELAIRANDALRQAIALTDVSKHSLMGEKAAAWANFSSLFSASGLGDVKAITEDVPLRVTFRTNSLSSEVDSNAEGARIQAINYLIRQSLDQALYGISAELDEVRQAQGAAQVLREEVESYAIKIKYEIFSLGREDVLIPMHERSGDRSASIDAAAKDSRGFVEEVFGKKLPWWKILWKVDDVRAEMEAAVDRSFAKDAERQMTFETGKLLSIFERLEQRTSSVFKVLSPTSPISYRPLDSLERDQGTFRSAFRSPILLNELRKHSRSNIESELKPNLLTMPIEQRREQLMAVGGPVDALCVKAQRNVLTTISIIGISGMATVVGALAGGPFGAGLPPICSTIAMQTSTALGAFVFSTTAAIWLLQTRWTRAKKGFWRHWERIADGLDADLRINLENIFTNIIGAQSIKGATGLESLAQKRLAELENVYERVSRVSTEIKEISRSKGQDQGVI